MLSYKKKDKRTFLYAGHQERFWLLKSKSDPEPSKPQSLDKNTLQLC